MTQDFALLKRIYNVFDPFRPLPAGDPKYVDCQAVRGDGDILVEIGREILSKGGFPFEQNLPILRKNIFHKSSKHTAFISASLLVF
ncbi:hypothetical protein [Nostoc sp.]|uniref:hypothetical protein n=1 Tax=Nostoc sp. TaxID=1180 RepID=UPI002FFC795E